MYLILKPEARKHIISIEEALMYEGFDICERYPIRNWNVVASKLYFPQIRRDPRFAGEFETYLWITDHFFGNSAAALTLNRGGGLEDNLSLLSHIKSEIRRKIDANDMNVKIFVNLDKLDPHRKHAIGIVGRLGIENSGDVKLGECGRWDDFYFKYIHVSNPNVQDYKRELSVLREGGVLDIPISTNAWNIMKQTQTLVYHEGGLR